MARAIKGMRAFSTRERREIRAKLIRKYGTDCQLCRKRINMRTVGKDDSFSVDHIIALEDGGKNEIDNMWPTHIACNERKGSVSKGSHRVNRETGKVVTHATSSRLAYSSSSY